MFMEVVYINTKLLSYIMTSVIKDCGLNFIQVGYKYNSHLFEILEKYVTEALPYSCIECRLLAGNANKNVFLLST